MGTRTVANLTAVISANNTKFKSGLSGAKKELNGFQKSVASVGPQIASVFAIGAITNFAKEAFNLASEAQGIERAFNKLNRPELLGQLRDAVRGTVSDVNLMKAAVKANNFKIPLDQLATFFQFAQQRANETGESVDYLVESIVNGIARKSLPILDNLGLSATEVRNEFAKTGDMASAVGNIISRSMTGAGDSVFTTKEKVDQLRASFENVKTALGERLTGGTGGYGIISAAADDLQKLADLLDKTPEYLKSANKEASAFIESLTEGDEISQTESKLSDLNYQLEYSRKWYKIYGKAVDETRGKEKRRNEELQSQSEQNVYRIYEEIRILKEYIAELNKLPEVEILPKILSPNEFSMTFDEYKSIWLDLGMNSEIFTKEEELIFEDLNTEITNQFRELSGRTWQATKEMHDSVRNNFRDIEIEANKLNAILGEVAMQIGESFATNLGRAIGAGEDLKWTLQELSAMIVTALGDILIYLGLQTAPEGIPLAIAGLALKGFGSFMSSRVSANQSVMSQYNSGGPLSVGQSTLRGNDIRLSNNYSTNLYDRIG